MAKHYRKQNDLLLPESGIALPDARPRQWYAGRLSPNRYMSRRKCCCVTPCNACTGASIYPGDEFILTMEGWTSSPLFDWRDTGCSNCSVLNDTFILTYGTAPNAASYWQGNCGYSYGPFDYCSTQAMLVLGFFSSATGSSCNATSCNYLLLTLASYGICGGTSWTCVAGWTPFRYYSAILPTDSHKDCKLLGTINFSLPYGGKTNFGWIDDTIAVHTCYGGDSSASGYFQ